MTPDLVRQRDRAMVARIDELEAEVKRLSRMAEGSFPTFTAPLMARLVEAAAAEFGVRADAIFGPRRAAPLALARHVVMFIAATHHHRSQPQIGRALGRDSTSVWHGIHRIEAMVAADPAFAARVERVAQAVLTQPSTENAA
jgi:chromosomal replication initiation ATPase DnaA